MTASLSTSFLFQNRQSFVCIRKPQILSPRKNVFTAEKSLFLSKNNKKKATSPEPRLTVTNPEQEPTDQKQKGYNG